MVSLPCTTSSMCPPSVGLEPGYIDVSQRVRSALRHFIVEWVFVTGIPCALCALPRIAAGRATICVEQAGSPVLTRISRQDLPSTGTVLRSVAASYLDRLTSTGSPVGPYPGGIDAFTGGAVPPDIRIGSPKLMIGARKPHHQVIVSKQGFFPGMKCQEVAVRPGNSVLPPPGYGIKSPQFYTTKHKMESVRPSGLWSG